MSASVRRALRYRCLALALALTACGGGPTPPADAATDTPAGACALDPALTADECATVRSMALPDALPPAAGNSRGDDEPTARLGFAIFYDARFSASNEMRCASCHAPERRFDDDRAVPSATLPVFRNSPTLLNAARYRAQFWDGRADSLWSQPLFALENPAEMNFSRVEVARRVALSYGAQYEAVFGPLPPLDDSARFPAAGRPGDPAWEAMSAADRDAINRVAANVGKALEGYMRRIAAGPSDFDAFAAGNTTALGEAPRRGLRVFLRAGCAGCHSGPMLTDERYHNAGVAALEGAPADRGRADAIAVLRANPFNAEGSYWEGARTAPAVTDPTDADVGAFRTPSLRNLRFSAPYGHNGRYPTLAALLDSHLAGGDHVASTPGTVDPLLQARTLGAAERDDLLAFLDALNGRAPALPWNDWPNR